MANIMYVRRNDKKQKMQELASRYYNDKSYTMKDYERDCDAMKVIPLDFTKFPKISSEHQKYINAVFLEEDTDRNGKYMLRGSFMTGFESAEKYISNLNAWHENRGDVLVGFGGNKDELFVLTWTEGDLTLTPCETEDEYKTEINAMLKWWEEER